jgi:tetratricopeptide (TPR) repeat protein
MAIIGTTLLVGSYLLGALAFLAAIFQWDRVRTDGAAMARGIAFFYLLLMTVVGMGCASAGFFLGETGQRFAAGALGFHGLCVAIGTFGSWTDAGEAWRRKLEERRVNSMLKRGLTEVQEHKWDKAVATCTKVIGICSPSSSSAVIDRALAEAYNRRAMAYLGLGSLDSAIADCNRVILSDPTPITRDQPAPPGLAEAYLHRGTAFARMGQHANAIEDFSEAIKLTPDVPQAYEWRAASRSAIGDINCAAEDARSAGKK